MSNQVLIVASDAAAKAPAEVAASLNFTPVITASEQEALDLLGSQTFSVIAVSGVYQVEPTGELYIPAFGTDAEACRRPRRSATFRRSIRRS